MWRIAFLLFFVVADWLSAASTATAQQQASADLSISASLGLLTLLHHHHDNGAVAYDQSQESAAHLPDHSQQPPAPVTPAIITSISSARSAPLIARASPPSEPLLPKHRRPPRLS